MRTNKAIAAAATVVIVAGGIVYLLVGSFGSTMIYYKTVDELLADRAKYEGRPVRVNGVVVAGSIAKKPGTSDYRFSISKRGKSLPVGFRGLLPDSMQEGRELVVQGVLRSGTDVFQASEILTKCPSKYEAKAMSP